MSDLFVVIFLSFFCHFFVIVCFDLVLFCQCFLSFFCHFFVIFLSLFHTVLSQVTQVSCLSFCIAIQAMPMLRFLLVCI